MVVMVVMVYKRPKIAHNGSGEEGEEHVEVVPLPPLQCFVFVFTKAHQAQAHAHTRARAHTHTHNLYTSHTHSCTYTVGNQEDEKKVKKLWYTSMAYNTIMKRAHTNNYT